MERSAAQQNTNQQNLKRKGILPRTWICPIEMGVEQRKDGALGRLAGIKTTKNH
jgi:hypothetical protein